MNHLITQTGSHRHPDIEHFRLEPFIDLSANRIIGYEVLSQLREGLDAEQWFTARTGRQQIALLRQQIQCVTAHVKDICFYNLSVEGILTLNHYDIEDIASYSRVCLEVADASALKYLNEKDQYVFFKNISCLRNSGIAIWADDFTQEDLITLPSYKDNIDGVKIDKSEIHSRYLNDIVRVIKKLLGNIPIVIEGVESERDLNTSISACADIGQGYYWGHKNLIAI